MKILIVNGPNINFLGIRERNIYGEKTYKQMCIYLHEEGKKLGLEVDIVQSNIEGEVVNFIQEAYGKYDGIVINPAAYTHYSIAIYDTIKGVGIPTVEVHISNVHKREEYRKKSVTAAACIGQICGLGIEGYVLAMRALMNISE
ncbi:type II 3-dehydroquinate dehydratase [Crassaminicella profunda]|uniref:type II 3-dehydroquinate dehydratase n=1 Tax=Crassaminicella profunda TaxID=1286698 RepID=UPI001CA620E3|nr:type II 3-dehydroquinate dehydratase [Crassaminicella profunda]QZY53637.1 type II 3-dehydroquinate dehydratase [Crassaminicella profunda]